jgi:predicted TIM-barrel fold metal-dependent hydrolase
MSDQEMDRRTFLARTGLAAVGAALVVESRNAPVLGQGGVKAGVDTAVSNSVGTAPPKLKAPINTCDCHMHIYDPARFPIQPTARTPPANAAVPNYRLYQKRIATTRNIVVTPSNYGTDNRITLDAIAQFGANARGIAVIDPKITDAELKQLHEGGVRGIRFTIRDDATTAGLAPVEALSKRIADLGWHVQLNVVGQQVPDIADLLRRLPSPIVLDHMAHLPEPAGADHPAFSIIRGLIDKGKTWIKLSAAYSNSKVGAPYPDATKLAQAFVKAAPERMVWGSDWPHPSETDKPDDAQLFDLMSAWAPDEATRHRIFVENPATLYGFGKA